MKPRVFVSSVIDGFEDYREGARKGIAAAGGTPVLVEDFPSLAISPRTACLDGVSSCDVIIVIVGSRGGWTTPSGNLVVEEEYEEARERNLKVLAFIQKVERDKDAQRLVNTLSHYTDGFLRQTFSSPDELRVAVKDALVSIVKYSQNPEVDSSMIQEKLLSPYEVYGETTLRFILSPQRVEEVIDPLSLESDKLNRKLMELGHSAGVDLFSYECPKTTDVGINEIVILQSDERRNGRGREVVRLEMTTTGVVVIDTNVTGLHPEDNSFSDVMAILEDDVVGRLNKCFAFASAFLEMNDKFRRYDPVIYNTALSGIRYRTLMAKPSANGSYPMRMADDKIVVAFDKPQVITRTELAEFHRHVDMTLALFRRRLRS